MRDLDDASAPQFIVAQGTPGPDTFNGGSGADTYSGLGARDVIRGGGGNDLLIGGDGDDDENGQTGDDTLQGDAGNDFLHGGSGNDSIDGGVGGFDTAAFYEATSGVNVDLRIVGPQAVGGGMGIDTLANVEGLSGSPFNDTLVGNDANNTLSGQQGDDVLDGLGGNDGAEYGQAIGGITVNLNLQTPQNIGGGMGVDTLRNMENVGASFFADTLIGTAADNYFTGRGGGDRITGNGGRDTVDYRDLPGGVIVNLSLGGGNGLTPTGTDTLTGIENLTGSPFGDTFTGDSGANNLTGRGGDDRLDGAGGVDNVDYYEATGGVTVDLMIAGPQNVGADQGFDTILNVENILGSFFNDTLSGAGGSNHFNTRGGGDRIDGRGGFDNVDYREAGLGVKVDLQAGTAFTPTGADTLTSIESATGSEGDDTLLGTDDNNTFAGRAGNDVIDGRGGFDGVDFYEATGGVTVNLSLAGPQNIGSGQGTDTILNVENIYASFFGDTLTGSAGDNYFTTRGGGDRVDGGGGIDTVDYFEVNAAVSVDLAAGSAITITGNDTLTSVEKANGTAFNDTLMGDAGYNAFTGRGGNDLIDGRGGFDGVDFYEATGGVRVDLTRTDAQDVGAGLGFDTILNVEQIFATFYADTLIGNASDNGFNPRGGGDSINGGAGFDYVDYYEATGGINASLATGLVVTPSGNDTLASIESLVATKFNDTLTGDAGTNNFNGRAGDDRIDGAGGFDYVEYVEGTSGITVDLNLTTAQDVGGGQGVDTLLNLENIGATYFADTITGTSANNIITGRGGGDRIDGGAGFDSVDYRDNAGPVNANLGQAGPNATLSSGVDTLISIEQLLGTGSGDTLTGDANNNGFNGRGGDDRIDGAGGVDSASYGEATGGVTVNLGVTTAQAIGGGQGSDTLLNIENASGGGFNDTLIGDGNNNQLNGVGGNDSLSGLGGSDVLLGGAGDDIASGGADADVLQGQGGSDTLSGDAGNDQLLGGEGDDRIDGGDGVDLAVYSTATGGVSVSLAIGGPQAIGATEGTDTLLNVEQLFGSNFNDTLAGDGGVNFLGGSLGNDSLSGAGGSDIMRGGAGDDTINGGANDPVLGMRNSVGGDGAYYDDATSGVTVDLAIAGPQAVGGGLGTDVLIDVENLASGAFGDLLKGNGNSNFFNSNGGDDTVLGLGGDDGMDGGAGNDVLDGGDGSDLVSYAFATSGVVVDLNLAGPQDVGGGMGVDTLISIESAYGSGFADVLKGTGQSNYIDGQIGDDSATGGGGDDTVFGAAGTDTLAGDEGNDLIAGDAGNDSLSGGAGADTALYSGARTDYAITRLANGDIMITDLRAGSPDGADWLSGVETAYFSDGAFDLGPAVLTIAPGPVSQAEGNSGSTSFTFTVTRTGLVGSASVNWAVTGGGANPASAADFAGGAFPSGTITFAPFEASKTITVNVAGDTSPELSEGFKVTLSGPTDGASIAGAVATGVIVNDDTNLPPTANADSASVNEDAPVTIDVLANDTDPDAGDIKTLVSVSATAKGASVSIVNNKVVYVADPDPFDLLKTGDSTSDSFTYTMRDANGAESTATVNVTVNGVADGAPVTGGAGAESFGGTATDERIDGGLGNDSVAGGEGADVLLGGAGNDSIDGGTGIDSLSGGDGLDTVQGGAGDDILAGGRGVDLFTFGPGFGHDTVIDFKPGEDDIRFVGVGGAGSFAEVVSHAVQSGAHVVITLDGGQSLQLNNVSLASLSSGDFLFA